MKTIYKSIGTSFVKKIMASLSILFVVWACNKSLIENENLQPYTPSSLDFQAATWKTVVLSKADEFSIPEPSSVQSTDYQAELVELKKTMSQLTDKQREAVRYWSGGVGLRWNQIMRELVAKYNLPPVANADGTYPIPSSANPLAYPLFPFANPPYAARAYAYVSVAQYDALVATWHYKMKFKRPIPSQTDQSIQPLVQSTALPSYPSEEAVLASVTLEMMKLLFPGEIDFLNQKAEECKNQALWSGKNTMSDLAAGEALGKAIAQKVIARAKTDNAGQAVGNPDLWKALEAAPLQRQEIPWKSLETPARPPMLPNFGKVKTWCMTADDVLRARPDAPPSTSSEKMKKELEEVKWYADNLTSERLKIVHYWADGVSTYTPPGHWNAIAVDLIVAAKMSEIRTARTFALLNMALADAAICCWDTKMYYFNPRPSQLDPSIKTGTGVPNFPAYTSGHSTFSASAATLLSYIFPAEANRLNAMATEASMSRLYGAIHYRSDCETGLACGKKIGEFAVNWGKQAGE
jgi:PAP2 superfamily